VRRALREQFPDIDCHPLVRPITDEKKLNHLESVGFEDTRPEFQEGVSKLLEKLPSKVKKINGKPLTGSMLLGLALEFVNSLNQLEKLVVQPSFERVVHVESERFAEQLFEEVTSKVDQIAAIAPYEEGDLADIYADIVNFANQRLCDKLQNIAQPENLVELRENFEKRVRSYFKAVQEKNLAESKQLCENLLGRLTATVIAPQV